MTYKNDAIYQRTRMVIGKDALNTLYQSKVLLFGVGGVGGGVLETLARMGVGTIDLVDPDTVDISNLNRQLITNTTNIHQLKVEVGKERILTINPQCRVHTYQEFYLPDHHDFIQFNNYDYIIDAIDTTSAKLDIITRAYDLHIPVISAMGCGNRMDPTQVRIMDIFETKNDPLARIMRYELRKRHIPSLKVVCSIEKPIRAPLEPLQINEHSGRPVPGSTAFVPIIAGIYMAYEVCKDLIKS